MGFNSVYRVLQEVFPQVDCRVLRAVAIEHSKDADVAVEVVLTEVMPFLSIQSGSHTSSDAGWSLTNTPEAMEACDKADYGGNDGVYEDNEINELVSLSTHGEHMEVESDTSFMKSTTLSCEIGTNEDHDQIYGDSVCENIILSSGHQESSTEEDMEVLKKLSDPTEEDMKVLYKLSDPTEEDMKVLYKLSVPTEEDMEVLNKLSDPTSRNDHLLEESNGFVNCSNVIEEQLSLDGNSLEMSYSVLKVTPSPVQNCFPDAPESSIQLVTVPVMSINDVEEPEPSGPFIAVSGKDISSSEMVDCENESTVTTMAVPDTSIIDIKKQDPSDSCVTVSKKGLSTSEMYDLEDEIAMDAMVMTQSSQICTTELLEDIIENARSEKITLRSAKDSLINLMSEVELKEKSVEQARQEAARGGSCTFARVEDLRQMVQRAKEANDMHAGEVYGEKAILATEVKELQSRLLSLSDESVKALAILDEIRQALEARLVVAEKEIKEAGREKIEKEESAQKYLAYEEIVMEKVVQESKILKQEAEENSKLREFLTDRGRLVDMLQGEISVICQDVKSMKEKFHERVPLSKSLSSSQTTCVLAPSSLSLTNAAYEKVPESAENPMASAITSTDDQFSGGEGPTGRREFVDAEWEFLDNP